MSGVAVALETSSRHPTIAVRVGDTTVERPLTAERAHASDLLPTLGDLLRELGAAPASIDTVFVGTGPGSYTGLRVGIATALGLVRANAAHLLGLPSTEVLAAPATPPGGTSFVLLDARSNELYFAAYRRTAAGIEVHHAPCVVVAADLDRLLPRGALVLADDDACRAGGLERRTDLQVERGARPSARALLELGFERLIANGPDAPHTVSPLYLRAFAVRGRRG